MGNVPGNPLECHRPLALGGADNGHCFCHKAVGKGRIECYFRLSENFLDTGETPPITTIYNYLGLALSLTGPRDVAHALTLPILEIDKSSDIWQSIHQRYSIVAKTHQILMYL